MITGLGRVGIFLPFGPIMYSGREHTVILLWKKAEGLSTEKENPHSFIRIYYVV